MEDRYAPLAGDPDLVLNKGREYERIGAAILRATSTLKDIVASEQVSEAVDATRDLAGKVEADISKAADRYSETGEALRIYSAELRAAQEAAANPAAQIATLTTDLATAEYWRDRRQGDYDTAKFWGSATEEELEDLRKDAVSANTHATNVANSLAYYQGLWDDAFTARQTAAATAADKIKDVIEGDRANGLNDDFWDKVGVVVKIIKVICDIAAILSIFLAWVPVLGQVLLVLAAVGAILAVIDAAIKLSKGEGTVWQLIGAVAMAALTLFGGKIIAAAASKVTARAAVQVSAKLGPAAIKPANGFTASLKSMRATHAMTNGQRTLAVLKSPFVRSPSQLAHFHQFKNGAKGAGQILKEVLTKQFTNPFKLKNILKIDDSVWNMQKVLDANYRHLSSGVFNSASAVWVGQIALSHFNGVRSIISVGNTYSGGDHSGAVVDGILNGTGHLDGILNQGKRAGSVVEGVPSLPGLIDQVWG